MNLGPMCSIAVLGGCLFASLPSQCSQEIRLDSIEKLELHHLNADVVTYLGRTAVRVVNTDALDSDYSEGIAIVHGASLRDGTIEATISGDTAPNAPPQLRGFVGIAFHLRDRSHFECFYIRPRNGRSQDQLQRNHSTQYISIPGFPWDKLRGETPGKYESYVDLIPGQWTQLKIQVLGKIAKLYVNGAEQPALMVNDLKQPLSNGGIALWVGQGTIAHFADLNVSP